MPEILHKTSDVRWLPTGDGEAYKVHHTFTVLRDGEMYFMRSEKYPYNWLSRLRYFLGAKPETTVALDPIDRKLAEVLSGRAI